MKKLGVTKNPPQNTCVLIIPVDLVYLTSQTLITQIICSLNITVRVPKPMYAQY